MRLYAMREPLSIPEIPAETVPGFTLTEIIDQFYAEGVVPDFIPADLGEDNTDEVDADGMWLVDPRGDIRADPFEMRENALMAGIKDPDPAPNPDPASPALKDVLPAAEPLATTE